LVQVSFSEVSDVIRSELYNAHRVGLNVQS